MGGEKREEMAGRGKEEMEGKICLPLIFLLAMPLPVH